MMTDLTSCRSGKLADKLPTIERLFVLTDAAHIAGDVAAHAVPTRSGSARSTTTLPGGRSTRTRPPACA